LEKAQLLRKMHLPQLSYAKNQETFHREMPEDGDVGDYVSPRRGAVRFPIPVITE
jgi:hypothetical protein